MALGTNRDYKTWDRITKSRLQEKYPVKLWVCKKCGRKNYLNKDKCPRCNTMRE